MNLLVLVNFIGATEVNYKENQGSYCNSLSSLSLTHVEQHAQAVAVSYFYLYFNSLADKFRKNVNDEQCRITMQ